MSSANIARRRLSNQLLVNPVDSRPEEIVRWFGAMQGQDYPGSLWALGARLSGARETDVERAIAEGRILHTWPMRGTIHLVPAKDAGWMIGLMAERVISRSAGRYRQLGLDDETFARSEGIIRRALEGGKSVTRGDLMSLLESSGVSVSGQRGVHIFGHLAQRGRICFGPRDGRQQTFVLLDEWVPKPRDLDRDEALAEIATRYFQSHGPATLQDFAWWSGLKISDCREAISSIEPALLKREEIDEATFWSLRAERVDERGPAGVHLLPPFDEYAVAYKDRSAALDPEYAGRTNNGLTNTVTLDGRIVGSWKRRLAKYRVVVTVDLFEEVDRQGHSALEECADRYGEFLGKPVELRV